MAIAVLLETTSEDYQRAGLRRQLLIVPEPATGAPLIFDRTSNGKKGKGNSWSFIVNPYFSSDEQSYPPVGVVMTDIDIEAVNNYSVSQLAKKALISLDKLEDKSLSDDPAAVYNTLVSLVREQSDDLNSLVHDRRVKTGAAKAEPKPSKPRAAVGPVITHSPGAVQAAIDKGEVAALISVPDPKLAEKYKHRTLPGDIEDFAMLDYALEHAENILLLGPTGSGKTMLPIAYASAKGYQVYSISGNIAMEPSQLFGRFVPDGRGGFIWIDGPVTTIVRDGGVLIFDEVNLISAKVLTVLYSLLDARREITLLDHAGEVVRAHKDLLIVATGNPGYVGTGVLSEAMIDRWHHRWTWGYDSKVEGELIKSKSLLALVNSARAKSDIETPISTRLLVEFEKIVFGLGWDYAVNNLLNRFQDTIERGAVKALFDTYASKIRDDLFPKPKTAKKTNGEPSYPDYPWIVAD